MMRVYLCIWCKINWTTNQDRICDDCREEATGEDVPHDEEDSE